MLHLWIQKNSKTSGHSRLVLNITDKINLKKSYKWVIQWVIILQEEYISIKLK